MDVLAHLLAQTLSTDEAAVRSATAALDQESKRADFAAQLLELVAHGGPETTLAAATYFKNMVRLGWGLSSPPPCFSSQRPLIRSRLLEVMVGVDGVVLKVLAEAFRIIAHQEFYKGEWPDLVPTLHVVVQHSNLMGPAANPGIKTYNALVAVDTILKRFQYFSSGDDKEPVPDQLEAIAQQLLVPLLPIFEMLVNQVVVTEAAGTSEHDDILAVICKAFFHAVRSHMPAALVPHMAVWLQGMVRVLGAVNVSEPRGDPAHIPRLKAAKWLLVGAIALITRHRKQADKALQPLCQVAIKITTTGAKAEDIDEAQERIVSLSFTLLAHILETGPGWRILAPHFGVMLEQAIFPLLRMRPKDIEDWEEDPYDYISKNLFTDLDDVHGWRDDCYLVRQSALNLLGVIAPARGPPTRASAAKAGKGRASKASAGRASQTAGEALVLPFLQRFPPPPDGTDFLSDPHANYYGVLLALGALHKYLSEQSSDLAVQWLGQLVLPLYNRAAPSPFLLANANWLLGEYASSIAEVEGSSAQAYDFLLECLKAPNTDTLSWVPVRASAAGGISELIKAECPATSWFLLLQSIMQRTHEEDDEEARRAFQLLEVAVDEGPAAEIVPHVPPLVEALVEVLRGLLPESRSNPWSSVVEAGFSSLEAVVSTYEDWEGDEAEEEEQGEEEDDRKGGAGEKGKKKGRKKVEKHAPPAAVNGTPPEARIATAVSSLLRHAWLPRTAEDVEKLPAASCLLDASLLLRVVLRHTKDGAAMEQWQAEALIRVWSELLRDWEAWTEAEDFAAFQTLDEVVALQQRWPLRNFVTSPTPPPPAPPVPSASPLENISTFLAAAIEVGSADCCWRACTRSHALLHACSVSFDGTDSAASIIARLADAAMSRLALLPSGTDAPLAKPLVLLVATCFLCTPAPTAAALAKVDGVVELAAGEGGKAVGDPGRAGVLAWGRFLVDVVKREEVALQDESECKLAALALVKLAELLSGLGVTGEAEAEVAALALEGSMRSVLKAKEARERMAEAEEEGGEDREEGSEEEDEEEMDSDEEEDEDEDEEEGDEDEEAYAERYQAWVGDEDESGDEGGDEEDTGEVELGVLGLQDESSKVLAALQTHGRALFSNYRFDDAEFSQAFMEAFPDAKGIVS